MTQLIDQAVNEKGRYIRVSHDPIEVGDVVLLQESYAKPVDYPMGLVNEVQVNDLGEVTGAVIRKGRTGELVKRHSSVIIPLLRVREFANGVDISAEVSTPIESSQTTEEDVSRCRRSAALAGERKTRAMLEH